MRNKSKITALAALFATGMSAHAIEIDMSKAVQSVKVSGDFRLRQDTMETTPNGANAVSRSRQRLRLRLGVDVALPSNFTVKTRFATGTSEQTSTNQTLDNLSNQKSFWVDRAYLEWQPVSVLKVSGGKMANPLWTLYSSDMLWDEDINPEGLGWNLKLPPMGPVRLFANALQMAAKENKNSGHDTAGFSEQIGGEFQLPLKMRIKVGLADHYWLNTSTSSKRSGVGDMGQGSNLATSTSFPSKAQDGNRRYGTTLANNFNVQEVTGEFSGWIVSLPYSFMGTYITNVASLDKFASQKGSLANTGYQVGSRLGKAEAANTWEVAYFYKRVQSDATLADLADSDFGDGGTNREGSIFWGTYAPKDWLSLKAKYFITKVLNQNITGNPRKDINRLQVDAQVKF